jgi:hypothetical protein
MGWERAGNCKVKGVERPFDPAASVLARDRHGRCGGLTPGTGLPLVLEDPDENIDVKRLFIIGNHFHADSFEAGESS